MKRTWLLILGLCLMMHLQVFGETKEDIGVANENSVLAESFYDENFHVVEKDGKFGIGGLFSQLVIPPVYEQKSDMFTRYIIVQNKEDKFGVLDNFGTVEVPFEYDSLRWETYGNISGTKGDKPVFYYFEEGGFKKLLETDYQRDDYKFTPILRDYIVVRKNISQTSEANVLYGAIDINGELIVPLIYKDIETTAWGYCIVESVDGKFGVIDPQGNLILQPLYEEIDDFDLAMNHSNMIVVKKDGKYGAINYQGQVIIDFVCDEIKVIDNQMVMISTQNYTSHMLLDGDGKVLISSKPYKFSRPTTIQGKQYIGINKVGKAGLIDMKGNVIIPPKYAGISFEEELGMFEVFLSYETGGYGYYSADGKVIKTPSYACKRALSQNLFVMENASGVYLENANGKKLTDAFADEYSEITENRYLLETRDMKRYIVVDGDGNIITDNSEHVALRTVKGIIYLSEEVSNGYGSGGYGVSEYRIANSDGKLMSELYFDHIPNMDDEGVWVKYEGQYGKLDYDGKWIIPLSLNFDTLYPNGKVTIIENGQEKTGLLNMLTGDFIIEPDDYRFVIDGNQYFKIVKNDKYGVAHLEKGLIIEPKYNFIGLIDYGSKDDVYLLNVRMDEDGDFAIANIHEEILTDYEYGGGRYAYNPIIEYIIDTKPRIRRFVNGFY